MDGIGDALDLAPLSADGKGSFFRGQHGCLAEGGALPAAGACHNARAASAPTRRAPASYAIPYGVMPPRSSTSRSQSTANCSSNAAAAAFDCSPLPHDLPPHEVLQAPAAMAADAQRAFLWQTGGLGVAALQGMDPRAAAAAAFASGATMGGSPLTLGASHQLLQAQAAMAADAHQDPYVWQTGGVQAPQGLDPSTAVASAAAAGGGFVDATGPFRPFCQWAATPASPSQAAANPCVDGAQAWHTGGLDFQTQQGVDLAAAAFVPSGSPCAGVGMGDLYRPFPRYTSFPPQAAAANGAGLCGGLGTHPQSAPPTHQGAAAFWSIPIPMPDGTFTSCAPTGSPVPPVPAGGTGGPRLATGLDDPLINAPTTANVRANTQAPKPTQGRGSLQPNAKEDLVDGRSVTSFSAADRTKLQIALEYGLPPGPVLGDDKAIVAAVKEATTNKNTMGGGFGVRGNRLRKPNTARGTEKGIGCCRYENGCRWAVTYELTQEGWYFSGYHFPGQYNGHNHPLETDDASIRAHRSGKFVPSQLVELATDVARRLPAASVHEVLKGKAKELNIPVSWDRDLIYDTFVRDRSDNSWDLCEAIELLAKRKTEEGLAYYAKTIPHADGGVIVSYLFAEIEGAMAEWARGGNFNVLLFDPTHNTNKMGLKLCPFVTVGPTGQTVILALALINNEDFDHILWAFQRFHETFKVAPFVLETDEGSAIVAAFEAFSCTPGRGWHKTFHHLCVFHISKNFWKHISPLITDRSKFNEVNSRFWAICKHTDVHSQDNFSEEWEEIVIVISALGDSRSITNAVTWLHALATRAPQFAYRFTWSRLTYLIHSTVRSEAINSALKTKVISANMKISQLLVGVMEYNCDARELKKADMVRLALRHLCHSNSFPPWVCIALPLSHPTLTLPPTTPALHAPQIDALRAKVTPYAFELISAQFALSFKYRAEAIAGGGDADGVDDEESVWHKQFRLTPMANQFPQSVDYSFDEEGNITSDALEDFGLFDELDKSRTTSLTSCSCQFPESSGLDLCRHRINRALALQDQVAEELLYNMVGVNIAEKWLVLSREEEASATAELRRMPAVEMRIPTAPMLQESPHDRYLLLLDEMKLVAEVASKDVAATRLVRARVRNMYQHLAGGVDGDEGAACDEEGEEDDEGEDEVEYSVDWQALMDLIHDEYEVDDAFDGDYLTNFDMFIKVVAYKWGAYGKKGWHVATVTGIQSEDCMRTSLWGDLAINAELHHFSDNSKVETALQMDNYAFDPSVSHAKHSWVCLSEVEPNVEELAARGQLHAPTRRLSKGKPKSKRAAPAHGPTACKRRSK